MAEYYLISQLPSLDGMSESAPLPITEERFSELCHRFLGKKAQADFEKITLLPPRNAEKTGSALIDAWNACEQNLRLALAKVRAEKLKKTFDAGNAVLSPELMQTARTAADFESPMEAERFLNDIRLNFLETLRPMDSFSEDFVFYYGIKLKLISRIRQFDKISGEAAYKNIYNSIINGDSLEALQ